MRFVLSLFLVSALLFASDNSLFAQKPAPAAKSARDSPVPPGYTADQWEQVREFQLKQAADAKKVSRDSPATPADPTAKEKLCKQPLLPGDRMTVNRFWTPRWSGPEKVIVGEGTTHGHAFDMTNEHCTDKPYDLYVPNETPVEVRIRQDSRVKCTATASYADNPIKDYGSVFTSVFTSAVIGGLHGFKEELPVSRPENEVVVTKVRLPTSRVKNTTATVTISCHADSEGPPVGVQQKVNVHYSGIDLFSGTTGALISSLGKKSYGVNTTDSGQKSTTDGTPITNSVIGVTSSSNAQFVPMGFLNINVAGNEDNNLNLQFGVGVNPNGSATQVEYFLSPLAFATHHVYFSLGIHAAQSQRIGGNFYSTEPVSSTFSVPTTWKTTYKLAGTISIKPYK